jgi:AraC family transcriptional regulator of adaptative response/methylated-DNA-[protein]-cysteine methyltransferase
MSPKSFRAQGAEQVIRFAVGECSLGSILVAASARGVCAVSLGDEPTSLIQALERRFARAELASADESFNATVAQVVGLVETQGKLPQAFPLDVQGTAFQEKVWRALRAIPRGKTSTYSEIAKALGMPRAFRAVARACGANPVAVLIPCHRVVKLDGSISGYRWGVERKQELLRREASRRK